MRHSSTARKKNEDLLRPDVLPVDLGREGGHDDREHRPREEREVVHELVGEFLARVQRLQHILKNMISIIF